MPKNVLGVEMYSTTETAELLGVTVQTVRNLQRKGLIAGVFMGKNKYYSKEVLIAYLNNETKGKE